MIVSGTITSRFGRRSSPGGVGSTNHKGLDIAAPNGTAIYAAAGGIVEYSGYNGSLGKLVIINHGNGVKTYYNDASGETRVEYTLNPEQGNNIILTIDAPLQKITQDAVKNCLMELEGDGSPPAGSAVVIFEIMLFINRNFRNILLFGAARYTAVNTLTAGNRAVRLNINRKIILPYMRVVHKKRI